MLTSVSVIHTPSLRDTPLKEGTGGSRPHPNYESLIFSFIKKYISEKEASQNLITKKIFNYKSTIYPPPYKIILV